jgi:hypothetical protein
MKCTERISYILPIILYWDSVKTSLKIVHLGTFTIHEKDFSDILFFCIVRRNKSVWADFRRGDTPESTGFKIGIIFGRKDALCQQRYVTLAK